LVIAVEDDPCFTRDGNDLHTRIQVPLYVAMLGGEVTVPLLDGKAKTRIPAETQPGCELRLKGQGMPIYGEAGRRGDLYATIAVRLPARLSDKERALVKELARLRSAE
jgi:curved DNA-binding protein